MARLCRLAAFAAAVLWLGVAGGVLGVWLSRSGWVQFPGIERVRAWLSRFPPRQLVPFVGFFVGLSLALPLYLVLRLHAQRGRSGTPSTAAGT